MKIEILYGPAENKKGCTGLASGYELDCIFYPFLVFKNPQNAQSYAGALSLLEVAIAN